MDEVNFSPGAKIDYTQSKIMNTYRSIKRRMQSRFTRNGILEAKLFIVSSKKSEQDFIESYIETVKDAPDVFISDEPQWNVKPPGTFSNKRFKVAVGDKRLKSRVINDGEDLDAIKKQGYRIIDVPLELKRDFIRDVDSSLMEFAGISSSIVTKFISYDNVKNAYCNKENPFTTNIISIGTQDKLQVHDFFRPELLEKSLLMKPLFIHVDASLTGDRTGISGVWAIGLREGMQYQDGEFIPMQEVVYRQAFSVGILCPSGDEISLEKNRNFIYYLKHAVGLNIQHVSYDGYQSADSKQQLLQAGFDASIISLDKKPDGYLTLKASINERRVGLLNNIPELDDELINLEQNNQTGKIDHPANGSKDIADSLAGALYSASIHVDKSQLFIIEDYEAMAESNENNSLDSEEDYIKKMQNSLVDGMIDPGDMSLSSLMDEEISNLESNRRENLDRQRRIDNLRRNMTREENYSISDEELENAMFNNIDDDIMIF